MTLVEDEVETALVGLPLFEYQEQGVTWMQGVERERGRNCPGGIMADAPGVGKTRQIVSLISRDPRPTNTLLIVPKNVLPQWIPVVKSANLGLCIFRGAAGWAGSPSPTRPTVWLTTHASLSTSNTAQMVEPMPSFVWNRFVVDEAHGLATLTGTRFTALHVLRNKFRSAPMWVVTGTPVVNNVSNLEALYYLVTCLAKERAEAGQAKARSDALINTVVRWSFTHMLHRTADELKERYPTVPFPPVPERITVQVDIRTDRERQLYDRLAQIIQPFLFAAERMQDKKARTAQMLKLLAWLDQLNVSPDVFLRYREKERQQQQADAEESDDDVGNGVSGALTTKWPAMLGEPSAKMLELQQLMIADMRDNGPQHWLVFCWFKEEVALLKAFFESDAMSQLVGRARAIFGGSKSSETEAMLAAYEAARATPPVPDPGDPVTNRTRKDDVLLLNIKSGGEGLNLQNFTRIVFMTRWWTDAAIQQGVGRAVRMGQQQVVKVYALMLNHVAAKLGQTLSMDRRKDSKALLKAALLRQLMRGAVPRTLNETEKQEVVDKVIEIDSLLRSTSSSEDAWVCNNCRAVNRGGTTCVSCRAARFPPSSAPPAAAAPVPGSSASDVIDLTGGYVAHPALLRGGVGGGGRVGRVALAVAAVRARSLGHHFGMLTLR